MKEEYWKQLVEEYSISLPLNPTDEDVFIWAEKDKEQRTYLLNNYGESSWNIWRFMELCRAEEISESMFRQLVRYEMDKNRKDEKQTKTRTSVLRHNEKVNRKSTNK